MPTINRRKFLQSGALGVAAVAAATIKPTTELLADPLGLPIALQTYTIGEACNADLPGALKRVREIGYKDIELGTFNYYGRKPRELRKLVADAGLGSISASFGIQALREDWAKHIDDTHELGVPYMICASLGAEDRNSLDAIHRSGALFNKAAEQCRKAGLRFAYHCHNFDFATVEGVVAYDELLRSTDPKYVDMEMDCFWTTIAGRDPVEYFDRHPGRFPLLHIKDLKRGFGPTTGHVEGGNPFAEVGSGVIDWKRIFAAAPRGGLKHYAVEQDRCDRPPFESIKMSYDYLHQLTV